MATPDLRVHDREHPGGPGLAEAGAVDPGREALGRAPPIALSWARTTEELFLSDRAGHWIYLPLSQLRPDGGAVRRNTYWRMFGMDLNHGNDDGTRLAYSRAESANREFSRTFTLLLREVWRGIANNRNQIGPNATDNGAIADLVFRLQDMLRARRLYGALTREEFYAVAAMSWFDLTVSSDNAVVAFLLAQGQNRAERLQAIGTRVQLPPHSRAYNYFQMADPLSRILTRIELGHFTFGANGGFPPNVLYDNSGPRLVQDSDRSAPHGGWRSATG